MIAIDKSAAMCAALSNESKRLLFPYFELEHQSPQLNLITVAQTLGHIGWDALLVDVGAIGTQQVLEVKASRLAMDASVKARDTAFVSAVHGAGDGDNADEDEDLGDDQDPRGEPQGEPDHAAERAGLPGSMRRHSGSDSRAQPRHLLIGAL